MKNIYKKYEDGTWGNYYKVEFPDGQIMDESNQFERDGFFYSDEPPQEYLDWKEQQDNFE